jgi:hypothetical protein
VESGKGGKLVMHRLLESGYVWANDNLGEAAGNFLAWLYWAAPEEWLYWAWAGAVTTLGLAAVAVLRRRRHVLL